MADPNRLPDDFAQGAPDNMSGATGQTRIIMAEMHTLNARIGDLSDQYKRASDKLDKVSELNSAVSHIKEVVSEIKSYSRSDFRFVLMIFGAGFIILGGMVLTSYLKIEDKVEILLSTEQRVETKLGDLLARIPPVTVTPSRR